MARKPKTTDDTHLSDTGTSSAANRRAAEAQRQAEAREARDAEVAALKADHKATEKRLANKPTDTRTIA